MRELEGKPCSNRWAAGYLWSPNCKAWDVPRKHSLLSPQGATRTSCGWRREDRTQLNTPQCTGGTPAQRPSISKLQQTRGWGNLSHLSIAEGKVKSIKLIIVPVMPSLSMHCGMLGKAVACHISVCGLCALPQMPQFGPSSLLMTWESCTNWLKCLGPSTHREDTSATKLKLLGFSLAPCQGGVNQLMKGLYGPLMLPKSINKFFKKKTEEEIWFEAIQWERDVTRQGERKVELMGRKRAKKKTKYECRAQIKKINIV